MIEKRTSSRRVRPPLPKLSVFVSPSWARRHALGGFAAGGAAGLLATAATYPLDYARGVLGGATSRPGGVSRVLADAFREGGVAALYIAAAPNVYSRRGRGAAETRLRESAPRGATGKPCRYRGARPTLLGSIPFDGIRFGVVGALRGHSPPPRPGGDAVRRSAAFGAVGGLAAGVATFPNDTIRRVLQQPDNPYAGYVDCARRLLAAHGVARFYRGLGANLVRAAPSAAIQFATFEWLASALGSRV